MLLRHLASILALPVTVIIILPVLLVSLFSYVPLWGFPFHAAMFLLVAGMVLIGLGAILLYSTILDFIRKGDGTVAPWDPTRNLIVTGFYSRVRNPMHIGVFLILIGENFIVGSISLTIWTWLFIFGNLIYIPIIEEQKLAERFGDKYLIYKKNVPRWIPRLSSWKPNSKTLKQSKTSWIFHDSHSQTFQETKTQDN